MMVARAHAQQQPDLTHSWVRSLPGQTGTQSYANGVAVLDSATLEHRGTVVVAGHSDTDVMILAAAAPPRGFVGFIAPDAAPAQNWLRHFVGHPSAGAGGAACTGVSVADRRVISGRNAFVSGWYSGTVNFGSGIIKTTTTGRDAFIAKLDRESQSTVWVVSFGGVGQQETLAVSTGPVQSLPQMSAPSDPVRDYGTRFMDDIVVACGWFTGEIVFSGSPVASNGGEDAFLVAVRSIPNTQGGEGALLRSLRIGGPGNERITAILVDPVDQGVLIAGYYSSASGLNFNPNNPLDPVLAPAPHGSNDIFVARYSWVCEPGKACDPNLVVPMLDWLFTTGTPGDDRATGVAVDVRGRAYATGWVDGGANGRDMWLAKIDQAPDIFSNTTTQSAWGPPSTGFVYAAPGENVGLGLTVDGLDRVIVTGQYAGTVDFDPSGGVDNRTSAGGLDMFVTRLVQIYGETPFPVQYDGTFTIGGAYDEVGSAVSVEGLRSQRLAHAGWFGAPNSPNGYTVDFDPGSGFANRVGTGGADAVVSTFLPTLPTSVKASVTITLDTSGSLDDSPDYTSMLEALKLSLIDSATTPRDQRLALNAVMFDYNDGLGGPADHVLPWTVIGATNAEVFARRLRHQPRRAPTGNTPIGDGILEAHASQEGDRISACHRTVMVIADGENLGEQFDQSGLLRAARDTVITTTTPDPDGIEVHQINAIAVRGDNFAFNTTFKAFVEAPPCNPLPEPLYLPDFLVASDAGVGGQAWGLGLALHTVIEVLPAPQQFEHPSYPSAVQRMLKRSTRCPGDFDRDGVVNPTDMVLFMTAWNGGVFPDADWNFDGCVTNEDMITFNAAHALGCCGP